MSSTNAEKTGFFILRVGLGIVFLIFGIGKFRNDIWAQTIKASDFFISLPWKVDLSLFLIGLTEVLTGAALIIGLFTRFFAALAAAELIAILVILNFQEVRDIGLLAGALYLLLVEDNSFGITGLRRKIKKEV